MVSTAMLPDVETLELALQAINEFAHERLTPEKLLELDRQDQCPVEIVREMCGPRLGIPLLFLPSEYGGLGGGAFDVYRICEALAAIDLGVATGVLATLLGSDPIRVAGTPQQKQYWLSRIAEEGLLFAYAATEPAAGSDLAALRTTAERVTENGRIVGYRITGSKQWISNGGIAGAYSVLALTPAGPSWFVVEAGAPGFSHDQPEEKHGIRLSNTAALSFDNVYVDAERLVGGVEGQGLVQALTVFGYTRLMVAAFALGAGWAALDEARRYSTERIQAGSPLSEKQGYTHKLIVPHAVRLEAARAYIEATAERIDAGEGSLITEGAIAKYLASEFANAAADAGIQALGGYGYTREFKVEKIKRDVRITTIYEGTSEIMEMTISRDRWQLHLKTRGEHYHRRAQEMESLDAAHPEVGAGTVALSLHALAEVLERARIGRLTRHQHILLRLGELMAYCECAASFAVSAAQIANGRGSPKANHRFHAAVLAAMSRVFARDMALLVVEQGVRSIVGADNRTADEPAFEAAFKVVEIHRAQAGLMQDMDFLSDALFDRLSSSTGAPG